MASIDKFDLLFFIYTRQGTKSSGMVRFKELMEFCNCNPQGRRDTSKPQKCSYGTLMKFKKELLAEKLLKKGIDSESGRSAYHIPKEKQNQVKKLRAKRDIYNLTNSFDTKWLLMLQGFLEEVRKRSGDPEEFFDCYCLGFIGGIPYNFEKSLEGMKYALSFEKNLSVQATRKGMTKEKYFREVLKKISKLDGIQKILDYLRYMGVTEEEIEESLKQQGGTYKVRLYRREKK
jgi:hypothetical protein